MEKKENQRPERRIIKMAITPKAKDVIKRLSAELGMKEQSVSGRVLDWFGQQDDVTQKHILNLLPKGYEAEILRRAAERAEKSKGRQSP